MSPGHFEIELKVRCDKNPLASPTGIRVAVKVPRHFEDNWILDFGDRRLKRGGSLLRLRAVPHGNILTWKGAVEAHPDFKIRREIEVQVEDGSKLLQILEAVGLAPRFRYQKYRTIYDLVLDERDALIATFDETPIGNFMELEGDEATIRAAMVALKIPIERTTKASYKELYAAYRQENHLASVDMIFDSTPGKQAERRP